MIVVADTGPLLHLFWVGASKWALPPQPIIVVEAVWHETAFHAPEALNDARLLHLPDTVVIAPEVAARQLDQGEAAALSYTLALPTGTDRLVLCDELAARHTCRALSLPVIGSLGLIVEAFRAGRVTPDEAIAALHSLPTRGRLHIAASLIEQAVASITY